MTVSRRYLPDSPRGGGVPPEPSIPGGQQRGIARTEYAGTTLRDHFGLPRPGGG